jgi:hypothetical protein
MFVRLRVNWIACGIAVGVLFTSVAEDKVNFRWIVIVAVMAVVGGLAARLFGMLCHIAIVAATAKRAGLLVPFDLMLGEDGVRTQSANGECLSNGKATTFLWELRRTRFS